MFKRDKIPLFWWSEKVLMGKSLENYGDLLGKYLVEKISGRQAIFKHTKQKHWFDTSKVLVTIGSILANVNKRCVVWGSGIISKSIPVKNATFLVVRGPQTRAFLLEKGYDVPEVYGDPAILLPNYYKPKVEPIYNIGVIPHYSDYKMVEEWYGNNENVTVIDLMTNDIEVTTDSILQCKHIVSSSLHGIIVAQAYGIPAVWQKFSDNLFGDDIKFQDYFESVGIDSYQPEIIDQTLDQNSLEMLLKKYPVLPNKTIVEGLQKGLLEAFPLEVKE
ncbi:polysaccharide pyruvyl transferase family protein [Mesoflavibacter sp. CH_XMU1404-2]|uniref:polysaccharide pyruvyl transferase family protein n=1 Tax=Mesoflavibacter sp. CH_XMU1404-2 TaxID=3107766 RepID=UPI00300BF9C4